MKKILPIIISFILILTFLPLQLTNASEKDMKVHFIDVGQGDSTLIELATGKNVLIDGGPTTAGDEVVAFLKSKGIKKLDYVIATHPDEDHIGGLVEVLEVFDVVTLINSGKIHTTQSYYDVLNLVRSKKVEYVEPKLGQVFEYDKSLDSYFQILYTNPKASDSNDASLVVKAGLGSSDFLFMADASTEIEGKLINSYDTIQADIIKIGHHGSDTSTSAKFISNVKPQVAVLSYGKENTYGHPHSKVVKTLEKASVIILKTATDCDITVMTNGKKYNLSNSCNRAKVDKMKNIDTNTNNDKPSNTTNDTNTQPPVTKPNEEPSTQSGFKNCTELKKVYPKGVKVGHPAYESKMDRDGDGHACE